MKRQLFFARANKHDIETLERIFQKSTWFVERVSDQKWLTAFVNHTTLCDEDWTIDPEKAMKWSNKPLAELEIIRMKLGDSAIAVEHELNSAKEKIDKLLTPDDKLSWTKEEVENLTEQAYSAGYSSRQWQKSSGEYVPNYKEWKERNLK